MSKIGITMGDPAGIGYEITAKALLNASFPLERIVLIGNNEIFRRTASRFGLDIGRLEDVEFADIPSGELTFDSMKFGVSAKETGLLSLRTIEAGASMAAEGKIDGICTAPVHMDALALAGSSFRDHTSLLTSFTSSKDVTALYELQNLRTVLLTRHLPIMEALRHVTRENVLKYIRLSDRALRLLGFKQRRIAVAALNPHGGEGGLLGDTEIKEIAPAIEDASGELDVTGPVPADVVYHKALNSAYDIVLSLYHDQAHVALKTFDFYRTVDMNIGLPFLRVSVDHGPGFDRAGTGTGIETNMIEAVDKTLKYAPVYKKQWLMEKSV